MRKRITSFGHGNSNVSPELVIIFILAIFQFGLVVLFYLNERFEEWTVRYKAWHIGDLPALFGIVAVFYGYFTIRRQKKIQREIIQREYEEHALLRLNKDLETQVLERTAKLKEAYEKLEAQMKESIRVGEKAKKYGFIVNTSADFMSLIDRNYVYEAVNQSYAAAQHKRQDEIEGRTVSETWGDKVFMNILKKHLDKCFEGSEVHYEAAFQLKTLGLRYMDVHYYPYFGHDGAVTHVVVVSSDITERKRAEEGLLKTNRLLEDTLKKLESAQEQVVQQQRLHALGQMASGIAHDFNNALSPILGFSELLLDDPANLNDQEKVKKYVEMINTSAKDAANVVKRLREFYRSRESDETLLPVNINEVIEKTIFFTQPKWKDEVNAKGFHVTIEKDLKPVPDIAGNEAELREMLTNIIFNAVDAMPKGGILRFPTYIKGEGIFLEVCDTGIGMTEEVRRRCMEPFFTTKGERGTGLGLSMVYGIIQRHGGEMTIESEIAKGSRFIIRFPVQGTMIEKVSDDTSMDIPYKQYLHVLAVDDDPLIRDMVSEYLKTDGHTVETAVNAREGMEKFIKGKYDIIVTDMATPEMSGEEFAAFAKTRAPDVPIIMLTGYGILLNTIPRGVDLVLNKPVTVAALRQAIWKVMGKNSAS